MSDAERPRAVLLELADDVADDFLEFVDAFVQALLDDSRRRKTDRAGREKLSAAPSAPRMPERTIVR